MKLSPSNVHTTVNVVYSAGIPEDILYPCPPQLCHITSMPVFQSVENYALRPSEIACKKDIFALLGSAMASLIPS